MSGRSIFTGLKATTHFGRPNFDKVLYAVHSKHPRVGLRFLHFVELVEPNYPLLTVMISKSSIRADIFF